MMLPQLVTFCLMALFATPQLLASSTTLRGDLTSAKVSTVYPGDANYASASQAFNLRYTFQPLAVAYPATSQDVSAVVKIAASHNTRIVARSGGHSYIANGLGGANGVLVVDMSNFTQISVDPSNHNAVIGTGNRLGDIASALNNNGRALPHGVCPYVGIGGHSGYGGRGYTSRMWGLTLDTIQSIDLVLPDGTITTASQKTNQDLFWALRGSAGSFGITTAITFKTFPAPPAATIFEYAWNFNVADASKALAEFQDFVQTNIPPQLNGDILLQSGSAPETVSFTLMGGWYGPANALAGAVKPFLSKLPPPLSTKLNGGTYLDTVSFLANGVLNTHLVPDGHDTFYAKSLMTPEDQPMSLTAITAFMTYLANNRSPQSLSWFIQVELYGGKNSATNAVAPDATAFANRRSSFAIQFYARTPSGAPPYPTSGFALVNGMVNSIVSNSPKNWNYGAYANYIDDRLVDWQKRYYGANYPKLRTLKARYDPRDLFKFPTAIEE